MLCSICVNFDVRKLLLETEAQQPKSFNDPSAPDTLECLRPPIPYFFEQHPNLLSLRSSAHQCHLCRCIWYSYARNAHPSELTDEALREITNARQIFIGTLAWDVTLNGLPHVAVIQDGGRGAIRTLASFEVCALRGDEPHDHQNLLARSIHSNSGSEECLRLAARLLRRCINEHKSCSSQYPVSSELPTRVIDTHGETPRLVDGNGGHGTFAALSYCWGGDTDFTLTRATEQLFRKGRPLDQFPATLRDAINITKALGIRYIWIDALCIIQDSKQDWEQESSRMREVYTGAAVTIAAACSQKTSEGIFRERPATTHPTCWLDWRDGTEPTPKVFLRHGFELWDERMRQSVLNTRGWVLQETLLAPRTLWFGHQQLCFECPKGSVDEAGRTIRIVDQYRSKEFIQELRERPLPSWKKRLLPLLHGLRLPLAIVVPWLSLSNIIHAKNLFTIRHRAIVWVPFTLQGCFKPPANSLGLSHFNLWLRIIENYSSRELTKPADALPALSGLAREFHRATGDTYVAGLWKMDIVQGLSWSRSPLRRKLPNGYVQEEPTLPETYLAPSWSWASILGRTVICTADTQFDSVKRFAEVIDISIELATHDPFGAVQGGSITLRAPFLKLDTQDVLTPPRPSSQHAKLLSRIYKVIDCQISSEYRQKHRGYAGQQFAIMQLMRWRRAFNGIEQVCFLLLESVEGGDSWRRIECLKLTTRETGGASANMIESLAILAEIGHAVRKHIVKII
ncbi:HET-domain-containing protein [Hypoxylon cercidicola]|nr:HET-domain-containing protein [Hypoxylon cercidicola]